MSIRNWDSEMAVGALEHSGRTPEYHLAWLELDFNIDGFNCCSSFPGGLKLIFNMEKLYNHQYTDQMHNDRKMIEDPKPDIPRINFPQGAMHLLKYNNNNNNNHNTSPRQARGLTLVPGVSVPARRSGQARAMRRLSALASHPHTNDPSHMHRIPTSHPHPIARNSPHV
jgi:hypothetical protein